MAKEFGWLPSQIKAEDAKDLKAITHILSVYNKVRNAEMERASKSKPSPSGRRSQFIDITDPEVEKRINQQYGVR